MNDATPIFEVVIPPPPLSKFERELRAFKRLLPGLLATHAGRYVAIHDDRVVDEGEDDVELVGRVHKSVGYMPIYVSLVADPQPVERRRRYRVVPRPELLP